MTAADRPTLAARDELAAVLRDAQAAHVWQPYEAACSCGVVPPVIDRYHAVDHHESEAAVDALLASSVFARLLDEARAGALRSAAEDFATGAWAEAWGSDGVDDDVGAVQSTEHWFLQRADSIARTAEPLRAAESAGREAGREGAPNAGEANTAPVAGVSADVCGYPFGDGYTCDLPRGHK